MLPCVFTWADIADRETGEIVTVMVPKGKYAAVAKRQFMAGEDYPLVVLETRSRESHNAYFAAVSAGFKNLPEKVQARWDNANHLRKWILVELGWYDEKEIELDTEKDARRLAIMYREWDEDKPIADRDYVRIWVRGKKVIVRAAKSQSMAAMQKDAFEASKKAVLDYIEDVLGVPRGALKKEAGKAA